MAAGRDGADARVASGVGIGAQSRRREEQTLAPPPPPQSLSSSLRAQARFPPPLRHLAPPSPPPPLQVRAEVALKVRCPYPLQRCQRFSVPSPPRALLARLISSPPTAGAMEEDEEEPGPALANEGAVTGACCEQLPTGTTAGAAHFASASRLLISGRPPSQATWWRAAAAAPVRRTTRAATTVRIQISRRAFVNGLVRDPRPKVEHSLPSFLLLRLRRRIAPRTPARGARFRVGPRPRPPARSRRRAWRRARHAVARLPGGCRSRGAGGPLERPPCGYWRKRAGAGTGAAEAPQARAERAGDDRFAAAGGGGFVRARGDGGGAPSARLREPGRGALRGAQGEGGRRGG